MARSLAILATLPDHRLLGEEVENTSSSLTDASNSQTSVQLMKQSIIAIPFILLYSLFVGSVSAQSCHPPGRERDMFVGWVKYEVSVDSGNTYQDARRTRVSLPYGDSSTVMLRTDSLTCANAFTAIRAATSPSTVVETPMVVKVGNKYVVSDSRMRAGEWRIGFVFDSTWTSLTSFTF